jgi:HAD superfamily hydrolase (TIGR01509 family)
MSLFLGKYTPTVENKYHHKPQQEFYAEFKKYLIYQGQEGKQVIFIDDHDDNLEAATQAGFVSIKFKSAEQLRQIFKPK